MRLSPLGVAVRDEWQAIPGRYAFAITDAHVVMPNHLHGFITLRGEPGVDRVPKSLSAIVGDFKSRATRRFAEGAAKARWSRPQAQLWQRSFHDRIVRNHREFEALREYVLRNPERWWRRQMLRMAQGTGVRAVAKPGPGVR
jgi:REP element-mobilizing transposase RayT